MEYLEAVMGSRIERRDVSTSKVQARECRNSLPRGASRTTPLSGPQIALEKMGLIRREFERCKRLGLSPPNLLRLDQICDALPYSPPSVSNEKREPSSIAESASHSA